MNEDITSPALAWAVRLLQKWAVAIAIIVALASSWVAMYSLGSMQTFTAFAGSTIIQQNATIERYREETENRADLTDVYISILTAEMESAGMNVPPRPEQEDGP